MDVNTELKEKAISLGLCEKWTNEWKDHDKDELVSKYVRGIDFCIHNDFPSIDYMENNFRGVMEKHGVFVNNIVNLVNRSFVVLNGECEGEIIYNEYNVGRIYVRHNSTVKIKVSGCSKVFISTFDNCEVIIECNENAKCYVYKHGGTLKYDGNVMVRE